MLCRTRQLSRRETDWEGGCGQCEMTERVPVDLVRQPSIGLIGGTETDREFIGPQRRHRRVGISEGKARVVGVVDKGLA